MALNLFGHNTDNTYIVDIESDGLTVTHDDNARVYLIGVTNLADRTANKYKSVEEWLEYTYDDNNTYVFHNASFDVAALRLRGAPLTHIFCTMVASHTLNPGPADEHSLGALMPDTKVTLRELLIRAGHDMKRIPRGEEYSWYGTDKPGVDAIVEEYLGYDMQATCDLYELLLKEYAADEQALSALLNINIPYIECILALQSGTAVEYDPALAEELQATADHAIAESIKICGWTYGKAVYYNNKTGVLKGKGAHCLMTPFNPNSGKQVAYELQRLYEWVPKVLTAAGAPCTSTEVLESLDYPLVKHLLNNSKATKLLSFCSGIKDYDGGYVYPSYNQCATRTTRLSCSKPL